VKWDVISFISYMGRTDIPVCRDDEVIGRFCNNKSIPYKNYQGVQLIDPAWLFTFDREGGFSNCVSTLEGKTRDIGLSNKPGKYSLSVIPGEDRYPLAELSVNLVLLQGVIFRLTVSF
jgi:hypothetical protein